MKTTNISKTRPNKTEAWFRSSLMPSGHAVDQVYSIYHVACMGHNYQTAKM